MKHQEFIGQVYKVTSLQAPLRKEQNEMQNPTAVNVLKSPSSSF